MNKVRYKLNWTNIIVGVVLIVGAVLWVWCWVGILMLLIGGV